MTIASYSDLLTAGSNWLGGRTDLTDRFPEFISLAEAKFNRELFCRQMEIRSTTTARISTSEPEFIELPDDFQSMRRVRLSGVIGKPQLMFKSSTQMDEYRLCSANMAGQPLFFSIFGTEIELCPTPDADVVIEMVYRANIPPLTAVNTSNWLLLLAPDAYLYGMLLETAPYIKEDGRIQVWGAGLSAAVDGLNRLGMTSTYNAGPLVMHTSGVTP